MKKDNRVIDVLEKMRVIKKTEDDLDFEPMTETYEAPQPEPERAAAAPPVYTPVPETPYGIENKDSSLFWEEPNTADRYLDMDQLYGTFHMKTSGIDTIYLIESYISTLPETLPAELRRSIILKIINASGFDFDQLLNDGIDRVSQLNDYSAKFASRTEEIVERHNVEIDALERQIQQIREAINERKNLHKRQFLTIESEAQRLKDVLDFITK
ncbi:MAG: hypothetical protein LBR76_08260 [Oscillospiraceae bacterium]|jgi:hypothetical protein|nr:hypothetical protein [Oscillospiraceae bacterium]